MRLEGFSINMYDNEGDMFGQGIFLHFDNGTILCIDSLTQVRELMVNIQQIYQELKSDQLHEDGPYSYLR